MPALSPGCADNGIANVRREEDDAGTTVGVRIHEE
jgi:hypothetical protein